MKNEIFIHTDRGQYIGGDIIYGTVFLNVVTPFTAKSLFLELKGYEKGKTENDVEMNLSD